MVYFKSNEPEPLSPYTDTDEAETDYDDGFDQLQENEDEYIPEMSQAEKHERVQNRVRMALGAGNLFGVITGTVLILILLTLIFSIIHFVVTDVGRNFSLFRTNF